MAYNAEAWIRKFFRGLVRSDGVCFVAVPNPFNRRQRDFPLDVAAQAILGLERCRKSMRPVNHNYVLTVRV